MPQKKSRVSKVGWFVGGLVLAYLGGCYYLATKYVRPNRLAAGVFPTWMVRKDVDGGGYNIPIWMTKSLAEGTPGRTAYVLIHGYGGMPGRWTPLAERLRGHGDVVIIATRGQTASPVQSVGFAEGESAEILQTAGWLKKHGTKRIVLVGISMGGSAAWLASAKSPELFDAIVTEGAFSRLDWASDEFLSIAIPHGDLLAKPVVIFASWLSGREPASVRPDLAAAKWHGRPGLVIHDGNDELFSLRHPNALSEAAGVPIWEAPGVKHAYCIEAFPEEYAKRLIAFGDQ